MRVRGTVTALNVAVEDPAAAGFRELGASVTAPRREMVLQL